MAPYLLRCLAAWLILGLPSITHAGDAMLPTQFANAANPLVGSWQSGSFAYTFQGDGSYVYVGVIGGSAMQTRTAEEGTYRIVRQTLIVSRQRGMITNTQNYRQALGPQTTTFPFALFNSPQGPVLRLTFPTGGQQDFYRR